MALTLTVDDRSSTYGPFGRTRSGGHKVSKSLYDAVQMAAERADWGPVEWLQGGLQGGAVGASAKTHDGLDVGDIRTRGHTRKQIFKFVAELMMCGVIGFPRGIVDSMDPHIHAVGIPANQAHSSARAQLYDRRYGYKYGGAGLAGARGARWYGPPRRAMISWEQSTRNPANKPKPPTPPGWYVVDPAMVKTELVGVNSKSEVIPGSGLPPGHRFYAVRFVWQTAKSDGKKYKYAVAKNNRRYRLDHLNRSKDQEGKP